MTHPKKNPATSAKVNGAKSKTASNSFQCLKPKARTQKKQPAKSTHSLGSSRRKKGRIETTQDEAQRDMKYDPATGKIVWLKDRGRSRCKGKEAGTANKGYITIEYKGLFYRRARLAWLLMTGSFPPTGYYVDHKDRCKSNDRWDNLRLATPAENSRNRTPCARNKSGFVGVFWDNGNSKWGASIGLHSKDINLGRFDKFDDACDARIAAEIEHFGEFSRRAS